ncbi:MAG: hypothetical protein Q27BPR15_00825 [Rhodobacter sp. CACIA14H1]|nr:MAG: hypothetical protein Q27BPR15_00825 [Rhodobacter sp. CACIA14H1]
MTSVSIGDLAQSLLLRRANGAAKRELAGLTAELSTGQAPDAGRHLNGMVSSLLSIDTAAGQARVFGQSARQAAARAAAMQAALATIDQTAGEAARNLLSAAASNDAAGLTAAGSRALSGLGQVVAALNARFAGASLFSGQAADTPPLVPADQILRMARDAVGSATTPDEVVSRLQDWMASPSGFAAAAYRGADTPVEVPVGPDETVRLDLLASDKELHGTIAGLVMGALAADAQFAAGRGGAAGLARVAGQTLLSQAEVRSGQSARLGIIESRLESAAARHSAEESALGLARNDLLSVDLYTTASRLSETETRLQAIHALTARLSRLSLTDYL